TRKTVLLLLLLWLLVLSVCWNSRCYHVSCAEPHTGDGTGGPLPTQDEAPGDRSPDQKVGGGWAADTRSVTENERPPGDGHPQEAQETHAGAEGRGDDAEIASDDRDAIKEPMPEVRAPQPQTQTASPQTVTQSGAEEQEDTAPPGSAVAGRHQEEMDRRSSETPLSSPPPHPPPPSSSPPFPTTLPAVFTGSEPSRVDTSTPSGE
ncbi:hypothetical protein CRUP_027412, partial [Coryphaenoides rupestris]